MRSVKKNNSVGTPPLGKADLRISLEAGAKIRKNQGRSGTSGEEGKKRDLRRSAKILRLGEIGSHC